MPNDLPPTRADILLVDDQPANLLALEAVLADLGETLIRAASGEAALRVLADRDVAVVLLDVRMPGLSGFETARRVRSSTRARHTPIIFLSAADSEEFPVVEAYRLGAVDYLLKPLVPDILRAKVAVFVDLFRKGEQVRALERRERERVESVLRAAELRFSRFMEHLPGLAWIKDPDGRYLYANDAAERAFGVRQADLYGKTDSELFPPETAERFRENDRKAMADPGGFQAVETLTHPDGTVHHSLVTKFPIPSTSGRPPMAGGMAVDVTDRMRAEDAQRFLAEAGAALGSSLEYEQTLAAVARLVVPRLADFCAVHVTEPDGRLRPLAVAHADPARAKAAEELGRRYPPDPGAPRGVPAVVRSGEPELVPELTDEMVAQGARDPEHLAILRGLGLRSVMIVPLAARGRTLGAITFVAAESGRRYSRTDLDLALDLGRRAGLAVDNARLFRESQEALRLLGLLVEAAGRLTGALDPAAVRGAVLDLSHRLIAADAYAIWRLDPDADDWSVAESAGLSEAYVRDHGRMPAAGSVAGRPIVAEDVLAAADLDNRRAAYRAEGIASLLAVPLRAHGQLTGTLVFYYRTRRRLDDVTVRVASALADLAGAALGTADLYARETASRRRAEEADRRKDEFIAMLAHELRNPLAPLRNSLQILAMAGGDAAVVAKARAMMDRQVTHLTRLVDDLLDASRITLGKVQLRAERLDLAAVARQVVADHRAAAGAAGLALDTRIPDAEVPVHGDPVRLAQVLDNLLTNALKFTPAGGRVEVGVEPRDGEVALVVRDTGAGIGPDMLPRLFQTFAQADRTLDRSGGGLGLGLAIVKGLAELHGGTAAAASDGLGRGATFTVTVPTRVERPALAGPPPAAAPPARPLKVLVVEDHRDAADSLRILLEMSGYQVTVAYTGPDGVRAAEEHRPDVVVCDIGLPGMDGYRVARALRENPATATTRLIALTGYGQDEDRRRAREAGFDEHLTKPADPAALESLLAAG
jgi:PAS domain S-box-containing protein